MTEAVDAFLKDSNGYPVLQKVISNLKSEQFTSTNEREVAITTLHKLSVIEDHQLKAWLVSSFFDLLVTKHGRFQSVRRAVPFALTELSYSLKDLEAAIDP